MLLLFQVFQTSISRNVTAATSPPWKNNIAQRPHLKGDIVPCSQMLSSLGIDQLA